MKRIFLLVLPALLLLSLELFGQPPQGGTAYKVLKKFEIGGDGGWDYLTMDSANRRLYITRGSHVMIMDVDSGKVVGDLTGTKGVHGVAIAPKLKRGFTSNGGDNTVTVFDTGTMKEIMRVNVGQAPDPILFDPATNRVFTLNAKGADSTVVAADTGKVVGTVKLGGRPETAVSDEKGTVYVTIMDKGEIVAVDADKMVVKERWSLNPGKTPTGLAIDLTKRRLFASCRSEHMIVMDADNGKILATLPIGKGTDACAFDAKAKLAFASCSDGTLTIVEETKEGGYRVQATLKTSEGAKTMALDTQTQNIYLATAQYKTPAAGKKSTVVPKSFSIMVVGK